MVIFTQIASSARAKAARASRDFKHLYASLLSVWQAFHGLH